MTGDLKNIDAAILAVQVFERAVPGVRRLSWLSLYWTCEMTRFRCRKLSASMEPKRSECCSSSRRLPAAHKRR